MAVSFQQHSQTALFRGKNPVPTEKKAELRLKAGLDILKKTKIWRMKPVTTDPKQCRR
jgi:hypothetical protein